MRRRWFETPLRSLWRPCNAQEEWFRLPALSQSWNVVRKCNLSCVFWNNFSRKMVNSEHTQEMCSPAKRLDKSDAYTQQWTRPSLNSDNGRRMFDVKPLSKSVLVYCKLDHLRQILAKSWHWNIFVHENASEVSPAKYRPFCLVISQDVFGTTHWLI